MKLDDLVVAVPIVAACIGWVEVRTKALVTQSERVQDTKHNALADRFVGLDSTMKELTDATRSLAVAMARMEGRLEAKE